MAEVCKFPLCKRVAEKNGYCVGHRIYAGPSTPEKKDDKDEKKYTIPKKSEKQKDIDKQLKKAYGPYLNDHPVCAIQSPVCTQEATCVNHTQGRGPKEILNQETWEPSCSPCNLWVEENHAEAEVQGHKFPRHQKAKR